MDKVIEATGYSRGGFYMAIHQGTLSAIAFEKICNVLQVSPYELMEIVVVNGVAHEPNIEYKPNDLKRIEGKIDQILTELRKNKKATF